MRGCQVGDVDDQKICFFHNLFDWPSLLSNLPVSKMTIKARISDTFVH